jgi:hypothetical protein
MTLIALVFTASVFCLGVSGWSSSFKSDVDRRTGGPEGLWLLDGIL